MWHGCPMIGGGWFGLLFLALFLVFTVGVIVLIIWLVARQSGRAGRPQETPLDILKRRYASGEISREEYERIRQDLS